MATSPYDSHRYGLYIVHNRLKNRCTVLPYTAIPLCEGGGKTFYVQSIYCSGEKRKRTDGQKQDSEGEKKIKKAQERIYNYDRRKQNMIGCKPGNELNLPGITELFYPTH